MKDIVIILILSCLLVSEGRGADTSLISTYGGLRYEEGSSIAVTFDKGFIMVGSTGSFGLGNSDIYIVKADSNGNYEWSKSYGGPQSDIGLSVKQTSDSGFVIAGYTNSFGAGGYDVYILKTDRLGDTLWTKTFGGTDWDLGYEVVQTLDGGYAIVGETYSFGLGDNDMYLIRIDSNGDLLWTKTYGGVEQDYGRTLIETADTGFLIAGATYTFDTDSGDAFVVKTNNVGDITWTRHYGGTGMDMFNDAIESIDLGYVFLGTTTGYDAKSKDAFLFRTDLTGVKTWHLTMGWPEGEEEGHELIELKYKQYVMLCTSNFFGAGGIDFYLVFADETGGFIKGPTFGYNRDERGYSLAKQANGGIALLGTTNSIGSGLTDMLLITTDSVGKAYNGSPPNFSIYASYLDTSIADAPISIGTLINHDRTISVYPNPAVEVITISIEGGLWFNKHMLFNLYDLTGRLVISSNLDHVSSNSVNISGQPSGVYFYEVIIPDNSPTDRSEIYKGKLVLIPK